MAASAAIPVPAGWLGSNNWGAGYVRDFDGIYPDLAAKYKIPLYPFFLDGVALDPNYTQADGMHPNPAGVLVIVHHVLPVVEHALSDGR